MGQMDPQTILALGIAYGLPIGFLLLLFLALARQCHRQGL